MRNTFKCALFILSATAASAQQWEVGAVGGFGYSPLLTVKNASTSASAGMANGGTIGFFAGEDMYKYWSGEANYLYRLSDFKLQNSSASVIFGGHTQLVTGDFLVHFKPKGSRIRPFFSFGGGIEVLQGTGQESASQPLGSLAALTATREVVPVGELGFGVKVQVSPRIRLRFQVRDYLSSAPHDVIAPAPGASFQGSLMNDVAALGGISATW